MKTNSNSNVKNRTAAVIFVIHVGIPEWHAKLFITDVPDDVTANEIKELLDNAGYYFGEFGQKWANHYVTVGLQKEAANIRTEFVKGLADTITYDQLVEEASLIDEID